MPQQLAHVSVADRPAFVSRHASYAEVIAGFAYRTMLAGAALLRFFRSDADIARFWADGLAAWTDRIDLDAEATRFQFIPE
jgi:hypothetical protein